MDDEREQLTIIMDGILARAKQLRNLDPSSKQFTICKRQLAALVNALTTEGAP